MPEFTGDPKRHDTSKFTSLTGSCLCGSINVTINDSELFTKRRGHLCHCANCRKTSGSYVATNLAVPEEIVTIEDKNGTLKTYEDLATGSGKPVYRSFCSVDGNPVMSKTPNYPGIAILKTGMFPVIPTPEAEGFALHKQTWAPKIEGIDSFKILRGGEKMEE